MNSGSVQLTETRGYSIKRWNSPEESDKTGLDTQIVLVSCDFFDNHDMCNMHMSEKVYKTSMKRNYSPQNSFCLYSKPQVKTLCLS